MKKVLSTLLLLIIGVSVHAQAAEKVPALKPLNFEWYHARGDASEYYVLYSNSNAVKTLNLADFVIAGTTNLNVTNVVNGVTTVQTNVPHSIIRATYPEGFQRGTNNVYVVAKNQFYDSDPSNILELNALGKPSAPAALRKP